MKAGRVIGQVTFSQAEPAFAGARWLVVSPQAADELAAFANENAPIVSTVPSIVVYDDLGAGVGQWIAYVEGAEATAPFDHPMPIDAISVAILDTIDYQPPAEETR